MRINGFTWRRRVLIIAVAFVLVLTIPVLFALASRSRLPNKGNLISVSPLPTPATTETTPAAIVSREKTTIYIAEMGRDQSVTLVSAPLTGGDKRVVTKFPTRVKEIKIFGSASLLYIGNPDIAELGDGIWQRSLTDGKEEKVYTPPEKFFIDSYIVSPDRKTLVIWLISPTVDGFKGGVSRVVLFPLAMDEQAKASESLLLEEKISGLTHYPIFISGATKRLYFGSFSPGGSMTGGVFSLPLSGGTFRAETGLGDGYYSSIPVLSPSGRFIAFTRQTGTATSNLPGLGNGFIPASERNGNTLSLYDLTTGEEEVVEENTVGGVLTNILWGKREEAIYWQELKEISGKLMPVAFWKKSIASGIKAQVGSGNQGEFVTDIGGGVLLLGIRSLAVGVLGSLDGVTSPVYSSYYLLYPDNKYQKVYTEVNSQVIGIE